MKRLKKSSIVLGLSVGYVLIHIFIQFALQGIYYLWSVMVNGQSDATAIESLLTDTYALNVIGSVLSLWIFMLICFWRKKPFAEYIYFNKVTNWELSMATSCAIGARMLVSVYLYFAEKSETLQKSIENASEIVPDVTSTVQTLVLLFSVAVVAPVFEEILFRGLVQRTLSEVFRPWLAIVLQAVMFGIAHGFLFQSSFAFVMGILLGIVYERTKSIGIVMAIHGVFNLSVVLTPAEMSKISVVIFSVAGVLLVTFSMFYLVFGPYRDNKRKS